MHLQVAFAGKSLQIICRKQKAELPWRQFYFRIGSFAKDCLQPLVNRI